MAFPFQDAALPLETRVNDLISRFTLEEKISLMCQHQPAVPRLGIQAYKHGTEAAHGVAWLGEATVFPQNIGLACTWNAELLRQIGEVIGDEARIYYRKDPEVNGLTLWAPTVDMERDPRWGRTEEAYGEDPHLTGRLTAELVKGMQGPHPFYLKTAATLKHFFGNNNERRRGEWSASIDPRNMREYYLQAFKPAIVEGGAQSIMTAYNAVNGTPCNLNPDVNRIVKQEWGMNGFVVSDAGDVLGTVNDHRYVSTYKEAVARSIKSGIDSITDDEEVTVRAIREALEEELLTEADLDHALRNTFRVRFKLGEFDPDTHQPYANVPESKLCCEEHGRLALRAARESVVLLKNENERLPLRKDALKKVAVIGPLADVVHTDWYSGTPPYTVTPLEGIRRKLPRREVTFVEGADRVRLASPDGRSAVATDADGRLRLTEAGGDAFEILDWGWGSHTLRSCKNGKYVTLADAGVTAAAKEAKGWFVKELFDFIPSGDGNERMVSWNKKTIALGEDGALCTSEEEADGMEIIRSVEKRGLDAAVEAAKAADVAIVCAGNSPYINGKECVDRPDITLPPAQEALIREVYRANPNMILVLIGSYPFAVNWANEHLPAILFSSHGGQELGNAIADVLFGDYNPAGRLNMTWYRSVSQLPDIMDYDIIRGKRTYQYFDGEPLYPFGYGLSYTTFAYEELEVQSERISAEETIQVRVRVKNIGPAAGDEVVQLYVKPGPSRMKRPFKQLKGFARIHLKPGQRRYVSFSLPASELAVWDVARERFCVPSGTYTLLAGRSSSDIALSRTLTVDGETISPHKIKTMTKAIRYDDAEAIRLDESPEGAVCVIGRDGGWIAFEEADFESGVSAFEARLCGDSEASGIEIRFDHPSGKQAGLCPAKTSWGTATCSISGAQGIRKLYLRFKGCIRVQEFRFIR